MQYNIKDNEMSEPQTIRLNSPSVEFLETSEIDGMSEKNEIEMDKIGIQVLS